MARRSTVFSAASIPRSPRPSYTCAPAFFSGTSLTTCFAADFLPSLTFLPSCGIFLSKRCLPTSAVSVMLTALARLLAGVSAIESAMSASMGTEFCSKYRSPVALSMEPMRFNSDEANLKPKELLSALELLTVADDDCLSAVRGLVPPKFWAVFFVPFFRYYRQCMTPFFPTDTVSLYSVPSRSLK